MFSTTYIAAVVAILAQILPFFGIIVGTEELTTTLQTIVTVVSGLWIMKERLGRGDISVLGVKN